MLDNSLFWFVLLFGLISIAGTSCGQGDAGPDDPILARVHNKELHLSDLDGMFPSNSSAEDSMRTIQILVNRWIRDAAVEWEAEHAIPPDMNIDQLVRDYRTSLIRSNYERTLENELVDTSFTTNELQAYFEEHAQQFLLERPIIRCLFIKVPHPTPAADSLRSFWNNGEIRDTAALSDYCDRYAELALLNPDAWYKLDEVADRCPPGTITAENVSSRQEFSQQDGLYRYYFRLFEKRNRLEVAPFSYVKDQVKNMILHERKRAVLTRARDSIYEYELEEENIKIYDWPE
ncbi:MAG: hypothetical protein AAFP08_04425 [Bacteroidota bacterium]